MGIMDQVPRDKRHVQNPSDAFGAVLPQVIHALNWSRDRVAIPDSAWRFPPAQRTMAIARDLS
jgi:hypothetical protein